MRNNLTKSEKHTSLHYLSLSYYLLGIPIECELIHDFFYATMIKEEDGEHEYDYEKEDEGESEGDDEL